MLRGHKLVLPFTIVSMHFNAFPVLIHFPERYPSFLLNATLQIILISATSHIWTIQRNIQSGIFILLSTMQHVGVYTEMDIYIFIYNDTSVRWIISVKNFRCLFLFYVCNIMLSITMLQLNFIVRLN